MSCNLFSLRRKKKKIKKATLAFASAVYLLQHWLFCLSSKSHLCFSVCKNIKRLSKKDLWVFTPDLSVSSWLLVQEVRCTYARDYHGPLILRSFIRSFIRCRIRSGIVCKLALAGFLKVLVTQFSVGKGSPLCCALTRLQLFRTYFSLPISFWLSPCCMCSPQCSIISKKVKEKKKIEKWIVSIHLCTSVMKVKQQSDKSTFFQSVNMPMKYSLIRLG